MLVIGHFLTCYDNPLEIITFVNGLGYDLASQLLLVALLSSLIRIFNWGSVYLLFWVKGFFTTKMTRICIKTHRINEECGEDHYGVSTFPFY